MNYNITAKDRELLREAAKKQLEYSQTQKNIERVNQWYLHNELKGERPIVSIEMKNFFAELLAPRARCEGTFAREIEAMIVYNYINQEVTDDDRVTPNYIPLKLDKTFRMFDIDVNAVYSSNKGDESRSFGHQFVHALNDLEDDYHKIKPSQFDVDMETTLRKKIIIEDAIGDILPVEISMGGLYSVPTQDLVHIMSMENMMLNMMDYPDLFKKMMMQIADDTCAYYDMLETKGCILPTVKHDELGNGSFCYTRELPGTKTSSQWAGVTQNVWGYMDSQETVCISPQMFEEFIFPCYEKIAARFGLLSYGCCEPVNPIWDNCLSKLKNMRKLSISYFSDENLMGEKLRGSNVIFYRKPDAKFLGLSKELDEENFRKHIRASLHAARGCKLEIAQREVLTIHYNEAKARRYIEIVRQEIESNWQG